MPIYEYACDNCGELNEVLQKLSDPPPEHCEYCQSPQLKRVMSRTSFQLKGDGWYITDYARKGKSEGDGDSKKSDSPANDSKSGSEKGGSKDSSGSKAGEKSTESRSAGKTKKTTPS